MIQQFIRDVLAEDVGRVIYMLVYPHQLLQVQKS